MTGPFDDLDNTDRVLLGTAVVAWLAALGAGVAAAVALVELGSTRPEAAAESADTPWLLYGVIGISVLVIAGAVPLLLRARSQAGNRQPARSSARWAQQTSRRPERGGGYPAARAPVSQYRPDGEAAVAVEQVWLRYTLAVACAMGVATALTGIGTYLLATDSDVAAWCCFGVAGLITVGMISLPIVALRQLNSLTV
ncbi:DUF2561 family protein [Mycobacterium sp. 21AC1]|uniref:DUF2561 family protein n=1 Tax=[Mycobacterium] appelbergii TaxID=2939269 RepID=UPI002938E67C|nr:DUF2561 family protein [Mycobacterium sp. 21AC1]MDV3128115.1 DUF2561 family protein [Mycobacterium sp. 21AC1]